MRGAEADGRFVVAAHPHAEFFEPCIARELEQEREVECGFFIGGRDAHQARNRQRVVHAARVDEGERFARGDAGLLRFFAGVDLDEEFRRSAGAFDFDGEGFGQARPVERVDGVEQSDGLARFVGLQRADEVKVETGVCGLELREFRLRFLDAVLAEGALTGGEGGADRVFVVGLADGDQGYVRRRAARRLGRFGDAGANIGEVGCNGIG